MNTPLRRILLALASALGLDAGVWAEFFPRSFYGDFPGLGLHFVEVDGPFNEHLVRDVGSFYLALTAMSLVAIVARTAAPGRLTGVGWTVFGALHFGYHLTHPHGTAADVIGTVVSLAVSLAIGLALVAPSRRPTPREEPRT